MNRSIKLAASLGLAATLGACSTGSAEEKAEKTWPGEKLFADNCLSCHGGASPKAPSPNILGMMLPDTILDALNNGVMKNMAAGLKPEERVQIAEYLTKTSMADYTPPAPPVMCEGKAKEFDLASPPPQVNWGYDNHRLTPSSVAGLTKEDLPRLKLKWAFAYPGAIQGRSQPVVAMNTLFVGSQNGTVYAFDLDSGCAKWTTKVGAEVRTGVIVDNWAAGTKAANPHVYFGDLAGNVHALDALTGKPVWRVRPDAHSDSTITGSPVPVGDTLIVPVSSLEVGSAEDPKYACCTFRGSVVALDKATGRMKWQHFTVVNQPKPTGKKNRVGAEIIAPSGAPVWGTPTVDAKRGLVYFGSGESYTSPADNNSDAVFAVDLKTGKRKWHTQLLAKDAWNNSCMYDKGNHPNCPEERGPDSDVAAPVLLLDIGGGKQVLVAGAKSGIVHALDPDTGKKLWATRVGRGGLQGGVHFGMAAEGPYLYVPIYDTMDDAWGGQFTDPGFPGVHMVDARTGKIVWRDKTKSQCNGRKDCEPGVSASASAIPGAVIAGHLDGWLRAYDQKNGKVIWQVDTAKEYKTANGAVAKGGSFSGPGATLYKGRLIVNSGYGFAMKMPGNALLVYSLDGK